MNPEQYEREHQQVARFYLRELLSSATPEDLIAFGGELDGSRRDTTREKVSYLAGAQLGLDARPGSRAWVRRGLHLRVAENRRDRALCAEIVKRRHYLGRWPAPIKTLILSYLADLAGAGPGTAGAAALVMVACLPAQSHVTRALGLALYEVLTLVRTWRADDLGPQLAPNLTPATLRCVVKRLRADWVAKKCRAGGLEAAPRLLLTFADPVQGHDGATYTAAGATACGPAAGGKLAFCWALDDEIKERLRAWMVAREEKRS
ncbi:MAG TPA: hypothetical protein PKV97_00045 [Thauera aminoaromatica]|nr:hypothetical protein [Thauera aminoaromatica]